MTTGSHDNATGNDPALVDDLITNHRTMQNHGAAGVTTPMRSSIDKRKRLGEIREETCDLCGRIVRAHATTIHLAWLSHYRSCLKRHVRPVLLSPKKDRTCNSCLEYGAGCMHPPSDKRGCKKHVESN